VTDEDFAKQEAELRKKWPAMFDHTQLKEGEVCVDIWRAEVAHVDMPLYKPDLPSLRLGELVHHEGLQQYPVLVNLREYLENEERRRRILDIHGPVPDPHSCVEVQVEGVGKMTFGAPVIESIQNLADQVVVFLTGRADGFSFGEDRFEFVSWDEAARVVVVRPRSLPAGGVP